MENLNGFPVKTMLDLQVDLKGEKYMVKDTIVFTIKIEHVWTT